MVNYATQIEALREWKATFSQGFTHTAMKIMRLGPDGQNLVPLPNPPELSEVLHDHPEPFPQYTDPQSTLLFQWMNPMGMEVEEYTDFLNEKIDKSGRNDQLETLLHLADIHIAVMEKAQELSEKKTDQDQPPKKTDESVKQMQIPFDEFRTRLEESQKKTTQDSKNKSVKQAIREILNKLNNNHDFKSHFRSLYGIEFDSYYDRTIRFIDSLENIRFLQAVGILSKIIDELTEVEDTITGAPAKKRTIDFDDNRRDGNRPMAKPTLRVRIGDNHNLDSALSHFSLNIALSAFQNKQTLTQEDKEVLLKYYHTEFINGNIHRIDYYENLLNLARHLQDNNLLISIRDIMAHDDVFRTMNLPELESGKKWTKESDKAFKRLIRTLDREAVKAQSLSSTLKRLLDKTLMERRLSPISFNEYLFQGYQTAVAHTQVQNLSLIFHTLCDDAVFCSWYQKHHGNKFQDVIGNKKYYKDGEWTAAGNTHITQALKKARDTYESLDSLESSLEAEPLDYILMFKIAIYAKDPYYLELLSDALNSDPDFRQWQDQYFKRWEGGRITIDEHSPIDIVDNMLKDYHGYHYNLSYHSEKSMTPNPPSQPSSAVSAMHVTESQAGARPQEKKLAVSGFAQFYVKPKAKAKAEAKKLDRLVNATVVDPKPIPGSDSLRSTKTGSHRP